MKTLCIRVDYGRMIGLGHLMRCLGIAQAYQEKGHEINFISSIECKNVSIEKRLRKERMGFTYLQAKPASLDDAQKTATYVKDDEWLVLDGYHFNRKYQRAIEGRVKQMLLVDDFGQWKRYGAHMILNQNIFGKKKWYTRTSKNSQLLLGLEYIVLRKEFWKYVGHKRSISSRADKILVMMGGSDPHNATLKVIQAMQWVNVPGLQVRVVVGAVNPFYQDLQKATKEGAQDIKLIRNTDNVPQLMAWADLCISAGGGTCWEMAFMGLPSVMIATAPDQGMHSQKLQQKGSVIYLGKNTNVTREQISSVVISLLTDARKRKKMSQIGQKLIDGKGAFRVAEHMIRKDG